MKIAHAATLDDAALTTELGRLAGREREASVALLVHLAEFDRRRLHEGLGYASTFEYCLDVLHMSEDAIYNRIEAARAAHRFPRILDMLAAGSLSLTTARLIGRRLTAENAQELLSGAAWKSKARVEELLARWFPRPDVAPGVRTLPAPGSERAVPARRVDATLPLAVATFGAGGQASATLVTGPENEVALPVAAEMGPINAPPRRAVVRPLSAARYEVRFTATAETREKLRLAQDLLGHAVPSGDLAQVFDRALTALIGELTRRKFGTTDRPRRTRRQTDASRSVPADVRRAVAARDGGRCAYVSKGGHRCGQRRCLEFHHVVPYAARGPATVENIALRCRAHNGYEVDRFFGPGVRRGGPPLATVLWSEVVPERPIQREEAPPAGITAALDVDPDRRRS